MHFYGETVKPNVKYLHSGKSDAEHIFGAIYLLGLLLAEGSKPGNS
jgi:hypothetical protein